MRRVWVLFNGSVLGVYDHESMALAAKGLTPGGEVVAMELTVLDTPRRQYMRTYMRNRRAGEKATKPNVGLRKQPEKGKIDRSSEREAAKRILETLNAESGRRYRPVDATLKPIMARLAEGYTEQELRAIAVVKGRKWRGDEKMEMYLRPETLYNATKCASYHAELPSQRIKP